MDVNSHFEDDMILYIEDPKDATRKLLEFISEFGRVAGYKINTQKFVAFIYTNNERSEREIQEAIRFTIGSRKIKQGDRREIEEGGDILTPMVNSC